MDKLIEINEIKLTVKNSSFTDMDCICKITYLIVFLVLST